MKSDSGVVHTKTTRSQAKSKLAELRESLNGDDKVKRERKDD